MFDKNHNVSKRRIVAVFVTNRIKYHSPFSKRDISPPAVRQSRKTVIILINRLINFQ